MFKIITDTSANIDSKLLERHHIGVIPFSFYVNDEGLICTDTARFDGEAYYAAMRAGTRVHTSQVTPQQYMDCFEPLYKAGREILYVGMSSGISGAYASAESAAAQLREEYPDIRLRLVDTLGASLGEGLLVLKAVECRAQGMSLDETADLLLELRYKMCQAFTVEDLKYLRRSGRLSNAKALIGTMLQIKPLLQGNREGKIISFARARGRKQSIEALAAQYEQFAEDTGDPIGIAHAGCADDAKLLEKLLRRTSIPPKRVITVCYEPVTGAHVGPGTLALFFWGQPEFRQA